MKRTIEQDETTSVISLGFLANKLELLLNAEEITSYSVLKNNCIQWENILQETIDFISNPNNDNKNANTRQPRFLSNANYFNQIYTATPMNSRKNMQLLASFLQNVKETIVELRVNKTIVSTKRRMLSSFAESLANEAINKAALFHQEPHIQYYGDSNNEM